MILFDYGQTLINEAKFNCIKGTEAVLEYATKIKHYLFAFRVKAEAKKHKKSWEDLTCRSVTCLK